MSGSEPLIYDMFGNGIREGDWVAFGRREHNTSGIVIYQYIDGKFHPRWRPGGQRWMKDEKGEWVKNPRSGHGWPTKVKSRPQPTLMMNNSINLSRWSDGEANIWWLVDSHD